MSSPFLGVPENQWVAWNALAFAIHDKFPVSPGHTLVITRREVPTWFEATRNEQVAILDLVEKIKADLDASSPKPDGYNVGVNVGEVAGQTVMHLHVHVIPRYRGDVPDPRGGVRHVIPGKGNYLLSAPLATGGREDPFSRHVLPLFARASSVSIVAAFAQESGLHVIREPLFAALARGAHIRLVVGDYLNITQVGALERLLGWTVLRPWAEEDGSAGAFSVRVVEVAKLETTSRAFHPKSWIFAGRAWGAAFVGSSNLSHGALGDSVEWNLRADRERDPAAFQKILDAFESVWTKAIPLTAEWVAKYAENARATAAPEPVGEVDLAPLEPAPDPNDIQREALEGLARARADGRRRALVVLATGLGKTWLAAFDVESMVAAGETRPPRVLFLAHRAELLEQAELTLRRLCRKRFPGARVSWFAGNEDDLSGEIVVASVQKLARPENLERLASLRFDYVVVDEVHHAAAPTYRKILSRIEPGFLLGLTATPDRTDDGDVLGLFDDHVAYRADLGVGIHRGLLVPFEYHGLKDGIDYENIPWRNQRFEPAELATAVQTQARMKTLLQAWTKHAATRTIVFCCSIEHARFTRDWLREHGVRVEAIHSGEDSADRESALQQLKDGSLDAICAVDLFNEGLDVPRIDRVVMLRPTESPVIFLQQLGRGLRIAGGKEKLKVIDFVGNHRVFLERVRTLLSLAPSPTSLRAFLSRADVSPELPPGCSVEVEFEAKEMLLRLLAPSGTSEVEHAYAEIVAARGSRPTAGELYRLGYRPSTLRPAHGGWFGFVAEKGDLTEREGRVLAAAREWLAELETTPMDKSYKMILLEALLESEALGSGLAVAELARRSHAVLSRSPELFRDVDGVKELGEDPRNPDPKRWVAYWRKNPVAAWAGETKKQNAKAWFRLEGERLVPKVPDAGEPETLVSMTRELVDYRLAQYRARVRQAEPGAAFTCKVISNQRDPILKLPSREKRTDVPAGEIDVRLPDGRAWVFRFMKEFVNVGRPAGEARNKLPDLLREWFGPAAGHRSTGFEVRFAPSPDGWWIEPLGERALVVPARGAIRAFPTLQAAAGAAAGARLVAPDADEVVLPLASHGEDVFAVRASGDSMDGGSKPIRDGDWVVCRWTRGAGIGAVAGRVALLQIEDPQGAHGYQLKRVVREGDRWVLRSDNTARPSFPATETTIPVATVIESVHPEDLAPTVGTVLTSSEVVEKFGLKELPSSVTRANGHLFILAGESGAFVEPDRLRALVRDRRPGETAFVLARATDVKTWRYVGVGRWLQDDQLWACPALDYATWKALGKGREASRRLPDGALARAAELVERVLARGRAGSFLKHGGRRCRLVGKAAKGGVRIDGGDGGFAERTVSLADIAWVVVAQDDVRRNGGALDEARVNRLRYLEGTPKGSTRWIDTGWAIVICSDL
jgi:superfamily II DNA or RNA helicase/diadenosine tetraphosphate (Ap4A) HIT family hydrolase/HKD family nuclease